MNIFKSLFRSRDKPKNELSLGNRKGWDFLFTRTSSGKSVNELTAMQTTAVYACVKVIAEAVKVLRHGGGAG